LDKKKCEYCGELIHINTRRCPFCASIVSEVPKEIITEQESQTFAEKQANNGNMEQQSPITAPGWTSSVKTSDNLQKQLSNAMKVFITVIACVIPGFGQLLGIIFAVVFMSDELDSDRRSFGKALMIASLVIFAFVAVCCILYGIFAYSYIMANPELMR